MLLGGVHPPAVPAKGSSILGKGSLFERSAEEATPPAFGSVVTAAAAAVPESPSTDEAEPPAKKAKFTEALAPVAAWLPGSSRSSMPCTQACFAHGLHARLSRSIRLLDLSTFRAAESGHHRRTVGWRRCSGRYCGRMGCGGSVASKYPAGPAPPRAENRVE
eukprot:COSAG06_NODE_4359_length_4331_cov_7.796078_1_plen_161_part_10